MSTMTHQHSIKLYIRAYDMYTNILRAEKILEKSNVEVLQSPSMINKGNLILFMGNGKSDLEKVMNNPMFNLTRYIALYAPRKFRISKKMRGTETLRVFHQDEHYNSIEGFSHLTMFKREISQYAGKNVIYDLTPIHNIFLSEAKMPMKNKILWFKDFINTHIINNPEITSKYNKITIMTSLDTIPMLVAPTLSMLGNIKKAGGSLDAFSKKYKTYYNKHASCITALSLLMLKDTNKVKSEDSKMLDAAFNVDLDVIFYSLNTSLLLIVKDFVSDSKKLITKLTAMYKTSLSSWEELSTEEKYELSDHVLPGFGSRYSEYVVNGTTTKKTALRKAIYQQREHDRDMTKKLSKTITSLFGKGLSVTGDAAASFDIIQDELAKIEKDTTTDDEMIVALNNSNELKKHLDRIIQIKTLGSFTEVETRLLQKSRDKFGDKKFVVNDKDMTISQILKEYEKKEIEPKDLSFTNTIHEELHSSRLFDMDSNYIDKYLELDLVRIFAALDRGDEKPLILQDITSKDTSDELNYKSTYTVKYKDKSNKSTTIHIDIPIVLDKGTLFLNGTKKSVGRQIFSLPLTKTKPAEAFINTIYRKIQFTVVGKKINPSIEKLLKAIDKNLEILGENNISIKYRNSLAVNIKYLNNIEYNYLSQTIYDLKTKSDTIILNRTAMSDVISKKFKNIAEEDIPSTYFPVGFNKDGLWVINIEDNNLYQYINGKVHKESYGTLGLFMIRLIDKNIPEDFVSLAMKETTGKSYSHSVGTILSRKIPTIVLASIGSNFMEVISRMNIDYELSTKKKLLTAEQKMTTNVIPFKDFFMYYQSTPAVDLLLNGMYSMNTQSYAFEDLKDNEIFFDYFEDKFRMRALGRVIKRMLDMMIDPITEEVLADHRMPNNMVDLCLQANILLSDLSYKPKNDMHNFRIKPFGELIPAHLYSVLMTHFSNYLNKRNAKYSVPLNGVLKSMMEDKQVETYSVLNPTYEAQSKSKATWRGIGGMNSDHAYTMDMLSHHPTMANMFGANSPEGNVGVVRYMSYDPKLSTIRGYINHDEKEMNGATTLSIGELLLPFTAAHDDPPRVGMAVKQTEHIIPTKHTTMPMVGTGVDKVIMHTLGTDFIFNAKQDGVVSSINEKEMLIIIKYKDGSEDMIDYSDKIDKNSSSGFFISNTMTHDLEVGQKFKKNDTLAYNGDYFKKSQLHGPQFTTGTLAKVAFMGQDSTVEDACIVSQEFADKISSDITMETTAEVDTNTNIVQMVKIGDHVQVGDALMTFERVFDDKSGGLVNMLDKLDSSIGDELSEYAFTAKKSKFAGDIVKIEMFYNKDIEEFTPNVQKIIKAYVSRIKKKKAVIDGVKSNHKLNIQTPRTSKFPTAKIVTKEVDGLLIRFYVRHDDEFKIGDKISFAVALKGIVSEFHPVGLEHKSTHRPDESIDAIISPLSIISRMAQSSFSLLYTQKILIELKRKIREEIYDMEI